MWDIILASPFLWQGQNLCWLCLALIIDWRVVSAFLHVHDEKGICVSCTCLEKMRKLAKNQAFRASNTQREGSRYCKNPRYMCRRLAVDMTLKRNFGLFLRAFSTCHCSKRGKNAPTGKKMPLGKLDKRFSSYRRPRPAFFWNKTCSKKNGNVSAMLQNLHLFRTKEPLLFTL